MAEPQLGKGKQLRLVFDVPESITSRYATNIVVQHTEHEFIVSFFELEPPVILGSPEEVTEQLDRLTEVHTKCIARIVIAPERMQEFVNAMQENLHKYLARKGGANER